MAENLDYASLISQIPTSYATCSIGDSSTPLPEKLRAIAGAGFEGVELAFPDLVTFASDFHDRDVKQDEYAQLCQAGIEVRKLCSELGLKIMMLQPFSNFEGWQPATKEREDAVKRAAGWIEVMRAVGTDMLQVGSSDSEGITSDKRALAEDLAELADLLKTHGFRLAYENWCWATHATTWSTVWEIVQLADRPNIGLCLDTFQTAGGEWGDPTTTSGKIEGLSEKELEGRYAASLHQLAKTIPKEKIYLLQISDAYKPPSPFTPELDESGLRPRGRWSHDFRPMPFDGGYLPIALMTRAVLDTGFRGWFSMEIFDGGKDGMRKPVSDLEEFAARAMESHRSLLKMAASTKVRRV